VRRSARFSRDRRYRYLLTREFRTAAIDPTEPWVSPTDNGTLLFVMLNPSVANGHQDDPTIRRCIGFARRWGHARLDVANLYARVNTDPARLFDDDNPIGPNNNVWLRRAAQRASRVVCAWGASGGRKTAGRAIDVIRMLHASGLHLHHLGLTASGAPRHPLYVAAATTPTPWHPALPG
jgi:hypothetical protein